MTIRVYTAKRIHTMNPSFPEATAVAVRDGQIIEAGTLETMRPWLDAHPHEIDRQFDDHILMPGFIDPHLHPFLGALLLQTNFITAMRWSLPGGQTAEPVTSQQAYVARLQELDRDLPPGEPLLTWGYHKIWHGEIDRAVLDAVLPERPVVIWQRSFHELRVNSAAITWMGMDEAEADRHPQVDMKAGRFFEVGTSVIMRDLGKYLLAPERYRAGLIKLKQVVHQGGHTTICDMGFEATRELDHYRAILDTDDTPFRTRLLGRVLVNAGEPAAEVDRIQGLTDLSTNRLRFSDRIKLFADGGYYAELMQVMEPGFIDGHHGEWMTPPEKLEAFAREAWNRGLKIHVHCTGDLGVELALDTLEKLQSERPRFRHGFTIEHFGLSTPEQVQRIAELGARVSVNAYYLHELGNAYWKHSLGFERASQMSRLGSVVRAGARVALHTDYTMAPAEPLNSAWVAVNRLNAEGEVMAPAECLTVEQAMRAITIDAAYMIGLEEEVGSIRAGKKADFTVLAEDPFEVDPVALKDIPVLATVFEGTPHWIER